MNARKQMARYIPKTPNQQWTRRWVELRQHDEQLRLWNDRTRFRVVPSGRRSGKTELAKRRLVIAALVHKNPPGRYFAAAPTHDQAKRIWWQDLKALVPARWRSMVNESEHWLQTATGAQLWVLGLDRPDRVEGTPWDGCVIDELASCKPGLWESNIRPALADRHGWAWPIGVPDRNGPAQIEYEKLYYLARSGADPEWSAFHWPSADILDPAEVESARRRLEPRNFEQEYLGRFNLAGGRAFPDFDPAIHCKSLRYDPALPLCWSLDFNINPQCSGILQHHRGEVRVLDEFCLADAKTDAVADAFLHRAQQQSWKLDSMRLYGDATGSARDSTSGVSDWYIIRNRLMKAGISFVDRVPRTNPQIKDTLNAVSARLKNADGQIRLYVDPCCNRLLEDLRCALWPSPHDLQDEHALAYLRYFVEAEYPIVPERRFSPCVGAVGFTPR